MDSHTASRPVDVGARARVAGVVVDVVVLSDDLPLFEATRHAVGERNPVWRAGSAAEAVDFLMNDRCGVLLVDTAALSSEPATLIGQIVAQFPDVVVVVAGRREDEALLARLIRESYVYRFMHKPLSPKRARMFLDAAIRCQLERSEHRITTPLLSSTNPFGKRLDLGKWVFVAAGLAIFIAVLGGVLVDRYQATSPARSVDAGPRARAAPIDRPLADPVLSSARAALASGRYEAPPGRNALDLYAAVLLARPDHREARAGLDSTITQIVLQATRAADTGNTDEARRLIERLRAAGAEPPAVRALLERLDGVPVAMPAFVGGATEPPPMPAADPESPPAPVVMPAQTERISPPPAAPVSPVERPALQVQASTEPEPPATAAIEPTGQSPRADPKPARAARPAAAASVADAAKTAPVRPPPPKVMRDPLTPRYATRPPSGAASTTTATRNRREFGSPVSSGHPLAGIAASGDRGTSVVATDRPDAGRADGSKAVVPDRELVAIATPAPAYPARALRDRVTGWVEVAFTVNETGAVADAEVIAAEPAGIFDAAATAAVAGWRFQPRVAGGRSVSIRTSVRVRFELED